MRRDMSNRFVKGSPQNAEFFDAETQRRGGNAEKTHKCPLTELECEHPKATIEPMRRAGDPTFQHWISALARLNGEFCPSSWVFGIWILNFRSAIEHVVPGTLRDRGYLGDECRGDAQFRQAFAEQFDHCIEVRVV
jgi:hypothetical protein